MLGSVQKRSNFSSISRPHLDPLAIFFLKKTVGTHVTFIDLNKLKVQECTKELVKKQRKKQRKEGSELS